MLPDLEYVSYAVQRLGGEALTQEQLTAIGEAYSNPGRFYHEPSHAVTMATGMSGKLVQALYAITGKGDLKNPDFESLKISERAERLQTVAGVYHDIVYEPTDGGPKPYIAAILSNYIDTTQADGKTSYTIKSPLPADKNIDCILDIFGFKAGDKLNPFAGQNEFMSALVMMHELEKAKVNSTVIAEIAAMIEGTIPFKDQNRFSQLEERLRAANAKFSLGLTDEDIKRDSITTVHFCNRDVAGFARKDFGAFIHDTLRLIPEARPEVRDGKQKPIEFLNSLKGPLGFFEKGLNPNNVFHHIYGYPSDAEFKERTAIAKSNIETGIVYLKSKIVSASLVAAVATAIDEPQGGLRLWVERTTILPASPPDAASLSSPHGKTVLKALEGRGQGDIGKFDIDGSPIGRLMFGALGEARMMGLYDKLQSKDMTKREDAVAYLKTVKEELGAENFATIIDGLAAVAEERNEARAAELKKLPISLYIGTGTGAALGGRAGAGG